MYNFHLLTLFTYIGINYIRCTIFFLVWALRLPHRQTCREDDQVYNFHLLDLFAYIGIIMTVLCALVTSFACGSVTCHFECHLRNRINKLEIDLSIDWLMPGTSTICPFLLTLYGFHFSEWLSLTVKIYEEEMIKML